MKTQARYSLGLLAVLGTIAGCGGAEDAAAVAVSELGAAASPPGSAASESSADHATPSSDSLNESDSPTVVTYPGDTEPDDAGAGDAEASSAETMSPMTPESCTTRTVPITKYGHKGHRICGFRYKSYNWGGGSVEWFVVGPDYAIWHIWKGSNGWHSLGGKVRTTKPNGAFTTAAPIGVKTIGTDNAWWCRSWPYRASQHWYKGADCNDAE